MTIRNLLADQKYQQKKVLEKILCHHTGMTKESLILNYDTEIDSDTLAKIDDDYAQYTIHDKPLEYIFGYVEFFHRKFKIDGRALIPRPETEYMIEAVNEHIYSSKLITHNSKLITAASDSTSETINHELGTIHHIFIDVGTGCGVLGLSVLAENNEYFDLAFLTEYYEDTLSLAKENFQEYHTKGLLGDTEIHLLKANLVDFLLHGPNDPKLGPMNFDLGSGSNIILVANLPYIPDEVFDTQTEDNVRKREPRPAFVGGYDGLDFYREMFGQLFELRKNNAASKQRNVEEQLGKSGETSSSSQKLVAPSPHSGPITYDLGVSCTMFLEMMTRQVDILVKEFGDRISFEEIKTFHFNIRIVKATLK